MSLLLRLPRGLCHSQILASTSYDDSTRVWNVLGEGKPLKQSIPNPIGSGGAGYALICVMAGEAEGGHAHGVISSAFHPTLPLLATSGVSCCLLARTVSQFLSSFLSPVRPNGQDLALATPAPAQNLQGFPSTGLHHPPTALLLTPLSRWTRERGLLVRLPISVALPSQKNPRLKTTFHRTLRYNESTLLSHQQYPSRVETPPTGTREYHRVLQWEWRGLDLHFPLLPSGTYNEDAGDERPRPRRVIRFAEPGVGEGLRGMASQFSNSSEFQRVLRSLTDAKTGR